MSQPVSPQPPAAGAPRGASAPACQLAERYSAELMKMLAQLVMLR